MATSPVPEFLPWRQTQRHVVVFLLVCMMLAALFAYPVSASYRVARHSAETWALKLTQGLDARGRADPQGEASMRAGAGSR